MLIALDVLKAELQFGSLVQLLPLEDLLEDTESVDVGEDISQVTVLHWLHFVDVERDNLEDLLLNSSHIHERTVVHQIETVVISDNIDIVGFIQPNLVDSAHESLCLPLLRVSVLGLLALRGDLLPVNRLTESGVVLGDDGAG